MNPPDWTDCAIDNVPTIKGINCLFRNIIQPIPYLLVFIAVVVIIYSGAQFMLAGTDEKKLKTASNSLTFALVGLAMMIGSWIILSLIQFFTGADILKFGI